MIKHTSTLQDTVNLSYFKDTKKTLSIHTYYLYIYIGDFNVHHTDWLQSTHTVVEGIEAFHFSIANELEQIINHSTSVPNCHDHAANTLDLFLTSNPQKYSYTVSSPLGSSNHCTVSASSSFTPPPPIPPTQCHLWHFENTLLADMSDFLLDILWNDNCFRTRDPDLAATAVGKEIDSGMRTYSPYSSIAFSPSNPWFDHACSSAISDSKGVHRLCQTSSSELTCATLFLLGIFALLRFIEPVHLSVKGKLIGLTPTEKCFWSLSKKICNNFCNSNFP